jgi:hypothetical protein
VWDGKPEARTAPTSVASSFGPKYERTSERGS